MNNLSIATVAMNRTEHLLLQARAVSTLRDHREHIIIDFGSEPPISRDQLPSDERIQLHRIESPNGRWWLTHSYNLAFSLSNGDYILKLDADILPSRHFIDALFKQQSATNAHLMCNRLTLQDWSLPGELFITNGLFLCKRASLESLRGFNPYIRGWGWDEIDLYSRIFLAGFSVARLPGIGIDSIEHSDAKREAPIESKNSKSWSSMNSIEPIELSKRLMIAQNEKNRYVAGASLTKNISWPSLNLYRDCYLRSRTLPLLPPQILFDRCEYKHLLTILTRSLLNPSRPTEAKYRILRRFGLGPYAPSSARRLLDSCGVDLSLIA
jgi:hypothetical protein